MNRELAFFIQCKYLHSNSCIYKYSEKALAEKLKCSRSKVRKYIHAFLSQGWCNIHKGKNLVFKSFNSILNSKKSITIDFKEDQKGIIDDLLYYQLKQYRQQCMYAYAARRDRSVLSKNPFFQSKEIMKGKRMEKKLRRVDSGEITGRFKVSVYAIAKRFKKSPAFVCEWLQGMQLAGVLLVEKCSKVVMRCSRRALEGLDRAVQYTYWSKGCLIKVEPSAITLLKEVSSDR